MATQHYANLAFSETHTWSKSGARPALYYVTGFAAFCTNGYAVVDDFGSLVQVPPGAGPAYVQCGRA